MTESVPAFTAMLRNVLGARISGTGDSFLDLVADDIVFEFPFAFPGGTSRLEGSAQIAAHLESLAGMITLDRMSTPVVYETKDPETIIIEVNGFGKGVQTGEPYDQRYICVIRTRNGRIVHYIDYWNPLIFLRALRGSAKVDAFLKADAQD
ncbi:MAG: nuclear transport factor 2 family protein [Sphingopyxis sp.]|nr:nuclear transport factor 2 family protein [Sphingopyxis sp.]